MVVMIRLILFLLFFTTVNCQLAYIWLNHHHFQCSQNTRNYHESIRHQYLCTSSVIWACISDVNVYSHNSVIFLDNFCGFIDGQNVLQQHTIWNIHLKPNINIHFLKFFLLDNYWYCDYEYLKVYSNNKISTFCGKRFPWVYDASDTDVKIILMTQRFDIKNYRMKLLYCGAYVTNSQHYIIFTPSSSLINIHYPNKEQNAFESFHFISSNRLDIVDLVAKHTCSKDQVVCYDGPGFKSPLLRFAYNQSVWECLSSTFQMMCKFSRVDDACTNGPRLYYRAIRAKDYQVKNLSTIKNCYSTLKIDEAHSKGTTKYIYYFPASPIKCFLHITTILIGIPFMLSEGSSCMYGGLYIVQSNSSKDTEILSFCTSLYSHEFYSADYREIVLNDLTNFSVVIIHYREYSRERINFHTDSRKCYDCLDLTQKYKEETLSITVSKRSGTIYSDLLNLRKIQYINITSLSSGAILQVSFKGHYRIFCMNVTIFYFPRPSNIWERQYGQEIISLHGIIRRDFIQSIFINMCACNLVMGLVWTIEIKDINIIEDLQSPDHAKNLTYSFNLPANGLHVRINNCFRRSGKHSFWIMFYIENLDDVPAFSIWRVFTALPEWVSHVSIEVFTDNHHSSSVYEWNHFRITDGVYITVNKAVNILIESHASVPDAHCFPYLLDILFMRHFIQNDKIYKYITGQAPQHSHFSFGNHR